LISCFLAGMKSRRRKQVSVHPETYIRQKFSFQCRNEQFSARSRKSRNYAEAYNLYAVQVIPQIDAEIAEKGHFWMETSWFRGQAGRPAQRPGEQRVPEMANTIRMSGQADDKFGWTRGRRRVLRRSRIPDPVSLYVPF